MSGVQISLAEVSELQGKGIDVLTSHVVDEHNARSASNDPTDAEAAKAKPAEAKSATDAKPETDTPKPAEKPKPDDGVQKRINEVTKARRTAERVAATERAERERLAAENAELREQAAKAKPAAARPKREDFDDQEAYEDALVDYRLDLRTSKETSERAGKDADADTKRKAEEATQKAQEHAEKLAERFAQQQEAARAKHDDYDTVIGQEGITIMPHVVIAIVHSDFGGELLYHLGNHPEVAEKLNELDQASMLKELGKIELSLTPKAGEEGAVDQPRATDGKFQPKGGKEISSAKAPIEPVSGGSEGAGPKDPERLSVADHRMADAKRKGRLR